MLPETVTGRDVRPVVLRVLSAVSAATSSGAAPSAATAAAATATTGAESAGGAVRTAAVEGAAVGAAAVAVAVVVIVYGSVGGAGAALLCGGTYAIVAACGRAVERAAFGGGASSRAAILSASARSHPVVDGASHISAAVSTHALRASIGAGRVDGLLRVAYAVAVAVYAVWPLARGA